MSRETKIVYVDDINPVASNKTTTIKHYESFGWEVLQIDNDEITLSRETQNDKYSELVKYEDEYEEICKQVSQLKRQFKRTKSYNSKLGFFLFILAVIPFIIYLTLFIINNKKIKENNELLNAEIDKLINKANKICDESRNLFFSKN